MMKKKLYLIADSCLLFSFNLYGQVGIGTQSVESDLLLKVNSTNKGVLLPNLTIPDLSLAAPVTSPEFGLLAYK